MTDAEENTLAFNSPPGSEKVDKLELTTSGWQVKALSLQVR